MSRKERVLGVWVPGGRGLGYPQSRFMSTRPRQLRASALPGGGNSASNRERGALYPAEQQENDNNDHDEAQPAGRIVTPTGAMGPCREGADEEQNQDNEEYRSEHNRLHLENNAGVLRAYY
jgi:hypothetical protein